MEPSASDVSMKQPDDSVMVPGRSALGAPSPRGLGSGGDEHFHTEGLG